MRFLLILAFLTPFTIGVSYGKNGMKTIYPDTKLIRIELPSNPTTGFQWSIATYNTNVLTLKSANFKASNKGLMGAPGTMQYVFSVHPGTLYPIESTIRFKYARPWEKKAVKEKVVTLKFRT
jgi:inhibitor of cysteine peptidase